VSNLSGVKAIAGGDLYNLALKEDGTVWAWGKNDHGQLGDETTTDRNTPVQVSNAPLTNAPPNNAFSSTQVGVNKLSGVKAIAGGDHHSLALKEDGTVWAWGENDYAQLGNGTNGYNTLSKTPVQVSNLGNVTAIAGARWHNLALKTNGTVWAWGENDNSELGDGTTTVRNTPVQVSNLGNVNAIAASGHHSLAKVLIPPVNTQ
jgi:alpha-tubulin suppressor-like RCC1 family protein